MVQLADEQNQDKIVYAGSMWQWSSCDGLSRSDFIAVSFSSDPMYEVMIKNITFSKEKNMGTDKIIKRMDSRA